MPKIISESDKQKVKDSMHEKVIALIKEKGTLKITVKDITSSILVSKGSFYSYYKSKEELIYEVFRCCEKNIFSRLMSLDYEENKKETIKKALYDIYLADDSVVLYVTTEDFATLLRKLPSEIYEKEKVKSEYNFQKTLEIVGIDSNNCDIGVLSQLMDSLHFIASNKDSYSSGKQKALEITINSIAEYLTNDNKEE